MPSKTGRRDRPGDRSRPADRQNRRNPADRSGRQEGPDRSRRPERPGESRADRADRGPRPDYRGGDRSRKPGGPRGAGPSGGPGNRPILPGVRGDLLYGRNAVSEALVGRRTIYRLLLAEGIQRDARIDEMVRRAEHRQVGIDEVPRQLLDDLTRGANHQGVGLDSNDFPYETLEEIAAEPGTVLVLDHLQDPQNFGTLIRAAEATGVAGVVIPQDRAVAVTPAVVNASAGAVEHLGVARVPNLPRALEALKKTGRWVIALDKTDSSEPIFDTDLPLPAVLVVGGEAEGIGLNVSRRCDLTVALPMLGTVASLNAATAGSIALFEILRRSRSSPR